MTLLEQLQAVRARIEKGWTKGTYARDKDGQKTYFDSPTACKWCLAGACFVEQCEEAVDYINEYLISNYYIGIPAWNDRDGRKKREVLELLDQLITTVSTAS